MTVGEKLAHTTRGHTISLHTQLHPAMYICFYVVQKWMHSKLYTFADSVSHLDGLYYTVSMSLIKVQDTGHFLHSCQLFHSTVCLKCTQQILTKTCFVFRRVPELELSYTYACKFNGGYYTNKLCRTDLYTTSQFEYVSTIKLVTYYKRDSL